MAASSRPTSLRDELSCSLCLEYFTTPVSIPCGHSFCGPCIADLWEEGATCFSCPRCGERDLKREFRPNEELDKVVHVAKRMKLDVVAAAAAAAAANTAREEDHLCAEHREPLTLFCQDEQKLLCLTCTGQESKDHATHTVVSTEEAARDYEEQLNSQLLILRESREKALEFQLQEETKKEPFLEKVDAERQKFVSAFEQLHLFLKEQEQAMLNRLEPLVKKHEKSIRKLSNDVYFLDTLIHETETISQQHPHLLLQNGGEILNRCKAWEFEQRPDISPELEEKLRAFSKKHVLLKAAAQVFTETLPRELNAEWVNMILDADTANLKLDMSNGRKKLSYEDRNWKWFKPSGFDYPQRFSGSLSVLGKEAFTSGIHYWEVKVGYAEWWAVGVARESVKRDKEIEPKPENGIWALQKTYSRCEVLRSDAVQSIDAVPETLGIYLDYESERVSFLDVGKKTILCTILSTNFKREKIRPYFCLLTKGWLELCS